jgi:outer membrane protein
MRKLVLLLVFGAVAFVSHAQTKIGYVDIELVFGQLPDAKRIETELQSTQNQLKTQIEGKSQEFQKKYQDYVANQTTMLEAVRVNTERELQQLQDNLQKLQQDAQTTIQNKHSQLMAPVQDKIGKAIEDVAKENGFNLILSTLVGGLDVVLYGDEKLDVSDLVLKKLGVTPKPAAGNTSSNTTQQTPQPKQ